MNSLDIVSTLGRYPTGNLCNAHGDVKAMNAALRPLYPNARIAGFAKTAVTTPGENAAIHRAVHTAESGQVLVVEGGANRSFGPFGDILATCCRYQGVVGAVIDSTIRDTAEITKMQFPIFSLGSNPAATQKAVPGKTDVDVMCGGVCVRPGDIVIGDNDGVVVIPYDIAFDVADSVHLIADRERDILQQLSEGKTTCEIFNIST